MNLNGRILETKYPDATSIFDGIISGAGDFYKDGTGTLTLNGNNTYTGTTVGYSDPTVGGGTLLVNGSQPQSPVTVSNGCILSGSGVVGSITVSPGCTVSPGNSAGQLTCSSIGFSAGSIFRVELNGTNAGSGYDVLRVLGPANLNNATLVATLGFASAVSNTFTILNKNGGSLMSGTFNGLPQNATFYISGIPFRISYTGDTGNDVVLTQLLPPPTLSSMQVSGHNLTFCWPTNYPGFTLQCNTNLNINVWNVVSPPPVISGMNYVVTNGMTEPQKFFRLHSP